MPPPAELPSSPEMDSQVEFFTIASSVFQKAARAAEGSVERFFRIAGVTICLRFASENLVPRVTPAFNHLAIAPQSLPDLTICLWERVSREVRMPLLFSFFIRHVSIHWWDHVDNRGCLTAFTNNRIKSAFHPGPNILSLLDLHSNLGLYCVEAADQIAWFETGSPMRTILNWWMAERQRLLIHAGAVGTSHGGALFVGRGGIGKSTAVLSCLNAGFNYAGDDYCIVSLTPAPYVHSLYNTAKLKGAADLSRFPHLNTVLSNPNRDEGEKAMFFLHELYSDQLVEGFPLKVIFVPRVTGNSDTVIKKASPGFVLRALAPSTIAQLPGSGQPAFSFMSKLVRQVPCYEIEIGTDIAQIPAAVSRVLSAL
ncbi:serine kinase [candidate division CSSED10-310 bacterium]|uniref:Serine kinase n=1 Tax=candidate division CSSED10-310 bacterium TaxID=2855610 RepID=A0ABV6Z0S2_UNCC1